MAQPMSGSPLNDEVISIDMATFKPSRRVPFDRPFILKMTVPREATIQNVFVYDVAEAESIDRFNQAANTKGKNLFKMINPIKGTTFSLEDGVLYMGIPPLKPNTNYDIVLINAFSDDLLKHLFKVFSLLHASKPLDAQQVFSDKLDVSKVEPSTLNVIPKNYYHATFSSTQTFYATQVTPLLNGIEDVSAAASLRLAIDNLPKQLIFPEAFTLKVDSNALAAMNLLTEQTYLEAVLRGTQRFAIAQQKPTDAHDFPARLVNLANSRRMVGRLKLLALNLRQKAPTDPNFSQFEQVVTKLESALFDKEKLLADNYKEMVKQIQRNSDFWYGQLLIASSGFETIQAGSSYYLIPEIGVANTLPIGSDGTFTYLPKLLLGFNLGFRPIDKNLKPRYAPREARFWYRTSFTVAITVQPIKHPDFGDFFNNSSLFVGVNYRLNRSIRLGTGPFFLRRTNVNPLISEKPIIVAPYVSLSFDVDITNAINQLTRRFF
ncbi:hypothetical protein [Fibrivirga algicola]|uniref:SbsA Ig-like domain-containing protein n=1 Tax=Fibrivirga algicola TaxID=2950420 RepID=A0ABX0QMG0_9BACT|nr:hypothetical protein [Fibrivirga algicola]NID13504.1 hypothetical protein [Fibrivirga algicola]